jgi:hypothetical protein
VHPTGIPLSLYYTRMGMGYSNTVPRVVARTTRTHLGRQGIDGQLLVRDTGIPGNPHAILVLGRTPSPYGSIYYPGTHTVQGIQAGIYRYGIHGGQYTGSERGKEKPLYPSLTPTPTGLRMGRYYMDIQVTRVVPGEYQVVSRYRVVRTCGCITR